MRTSLAALVVLPVLIFGQDQEKTFYFTHSVSAGEITAITTAIRTAVDLQDLLPDEQHQSLKASGPLDKLVAADWLFQRLDNPASADLAASYKIQGRHGEEDIRVLPVSPRATQADITALVTSIRTVVDIQRLFPFVHPNILVLRTTPPQMEAVAWLVGQLLPLAGAPPTTDSPAHPLPHANPAFTEKEVIQIFRMDPETTAAQLASTVTAIRTVADLQCLFPFQSETAIIAGAAPEKVAVAGWLVHELATPADPTTVHQIMMPGLLDGLVRLFYAAPGVNLSALAVEIRASTGIQRLFPIAHASAVIVRGRPDQMSTVEMLVAKFTAAQR